METQGKLLIVDDELSVRDSLGKWFREEGYEIGTAESASDALTRMAENKWELALLDIKMRGTDGIELQRRLHEMDPDLIVIMMTGYAESEYAIDALNAGASAYLLKPANIERNVAAPPCFVRATRWIELTQTIAATRTTRHSPYAHTAPSA